MITLRSSQAPGRLGPDGAERISAGVYGLAFGADPQTATLFGVIGATLLLGLEAVIGVRLRRGIRLLHRAPAASGGHCLPEHRRLPWYITQTKDADDPRDPPQPNWRAMILTLDPHSKTPPFEQLRVQVIEGVRSGTLAPGDRLPTVRRLAEDLGLAANTVARAYRELERDEVIETRGRLGSFIAATGDATHKQAQLAAIEYARRARALGLSDNDALRIVTAALGIRSH